ncbi:MAG: hypothetical protein R8F63_06465 [Acidimicrobiales bacterium]|nr:hypothetical protein [Acidimicrobiales bacterium]
MPQSTSRTNAFSSPTVVPLTHVDHIVFNVDDIELTVEWWRDRFGLEAERLDDWRAGNAPFPWIRVSETLILDLFASSLDGRNIDHVAFTTDPDSFEAFIRTHTDDIRMGPAELGGARGRGRGVYLDDPSGNRIELRTYD